MKRFIKALFVVGSMGLIFAASAQAQVTSNSAAGGTTAAADITLSGTIQSAIVLTISGTGLSTASDTMPNRTAGTFAFGTFSTTQTTPLAAGTLHRAGAGAYVVASLSALVTISGTSNNARVLLSTVAGTGGASAVTDGNVRFTQGAGVWNAAGQGTDLAFGAAGTDLCPALGCVNATPYPHDLALYIPDATPAGAFSQVISYDASIL